MYDIKLFEINAAEEEQTYHLLHCDHVEIIEGNLYFDKLIGLNINCKIEIDLKTVSKFELSTSDCYDDEEL